MTFSVQGGQLRVASGAVREFERNIKRVLDTGSVFVVLLDPDNGPQMSENVFGVDSSTRLLWRVPVFEFPHGNPPYREISLAEGLDEGEGVAAYNRSGIMAMLDPATGEIIRSFLAK